MVQDANGVASENIVRHIRDQALHIRRRLGVIHDMRCENDAERGSHFRSVLRSGKEIQKVPAERISGSDRETDKLYGVLCLRGCEGLQRLASFSVRVLGNIVGRPDDETRRENYSSQVLDESVAWTTSDVRHCDWTITRENEIPFREIVQERAIDICSDFFFVSGCLERRIDIFVDITIELDPRTHALLPPKV